MTRTPDEMRNDLMTALGEHFTAIAKATPQDEDDDSPQKRTRIKYTDDNGSSIDIESTEDIERLAEVLETMLHASR